ncbi:MAG: hypothetical protein AAF208_03315 [Cyanobacteria bacterium P01_A01_bin.45]
MAIETASEVILRTAQRFDKIKHLDDTTVKRLMGLSEDDFKIEYKKLTSNM